MSKSVRKPLSSRLPDLPHHLRENGSAFVQTERPKWRGRKPKSEFETGFGMFYHAALLSGVLSPKTEDFLLDYYLSKPDGMFYIYDKPLNKPPIVFASRSAGRYLAAIEVLSRYGRAKDKLAFVID